MKRLAIIISLLIVTFSFTIGQTSTDSISIRKVVGGYQFYQGEKLLKMNQLVETVKPNEQAYIQMKSAQSSSILASVFGFAGGFMVGWPIGTAIGGGDANWAIAGIGAGFIVAAIPISINSNKKAKLAVDTYNGELQANSFWDRNELKLSMTGNGIGLALNF